jgi:hypothetical protein
MFLASENTTPPKIRIAIWKFHVIVCKTIIYEITIPYLLKGGRPAGEDLLECEYIDSS